MASSRPPDNGVSAIVSSSAMAAVTMSCGNATGRGPRLGWSIIMLVVALTGGSMRPAPSVVCDVKTGRPDVFFATERRCGRGASWHLKPKDNLHYVPEGLMQ
jgi:hypothetical protein